MGVSRDACSSFMTALVVYHGDGDLHHVFARGVTQCLHRGGE